MELGDGLQLLAPDLARTAHIPEIDFWFLRLASLGPAAAAGLPYHGIDLFLVQHVLHNAGLLQPFNLSLVPRLSARLAPTGPPASPWASPGSSAHPAAPADAPPPGNESATPATLQFPARRL